jgi:hypothetical protein
MKEQPIKLKEQEIWKDYPFKGYENLALAICFDGKVLGRLLE